MTSETIDIFHFTSVDDLVSNLINTVDVLLYVEVVLYVNLTPFAWITDLANFYIRTYVAPSVIFESD